MAFHGGEGILNHSGEPQLVEREAESGFGKVRQELTGLVDSVSFNEGEGQRRCERGNSGIVGGKLLDERDELTHRSPLVADSHHLSTKEESDVWLAAVGPDLEGSSGELFGFIAVPGDEGPPCPHEEMSPTQCWLVELLRKRRQHLEASVLLVDVSHESCGVCAPQGGKKQ